MKEVTALLRGASDAGFPGLSMCATEPRTGSVSRPERVHGGVGVKASEQRGIGPDPFVPELKFPLILIDTTGFIQNANNAARRMLRASDIVCDRDGMLSCASPENNRALREAVHELHAPVESWHRPSVRAVRFYRRDCSQLHLFMCSVQPVDGDSRCAMILVHDSRRDDDESDADLVGDAFDLTHAEARVALKLANGWTVKDIARAHCTSVTTVRSQVQHTLHKVGVSRQVDLVRLLSCIGLLPLGPASDRAERLRSESARQPRPSVLPPGQICVCPDDQTRGVTVESRRTDQ